MIQTTKVKITETKPEADGLKLSELVPGDYFKFVADEAREDGVCQRVFDGFRWMDLTYADGRAVEIPAGDQRWHRQVVLFEEVEIILGKPRSHR